MVWGGGPMLSRGPGTPPDPPPATPMEQDEPCVVELHDSDEAGMVRRVYIGEEGSAEPRGAGKEPRGRGGKEPWGGGGGSQPPPQPLCGLQLMMAS